MGRCKIGLILLLWFTSEPPVWTHREQVGSVGFWKEEQSRQFCLSCQEVAGCSEAACWALWPIHWAAFPEPLRFYVLLVSTAPEAVFASRPHTVWCALTVAAVSSSGCLPGQSLFLLLVSKPWHCWWVTWPKSTARTMLDCPRDSELLHRDRATVHCDFFPADIVLCKLWDVKKICGEVLGSIKGLC